MLCQKVCYMCVEFGLPFRKRTMYMPLLKLLVLVALLALALLVDQIIVIFLNLLTEMNWLDCSQYARPCRSLNPESLIWCSNRFYDKILFGGKYHLANWSKLLQYKTLPVVVGVQGDNWFSCGCFPFRSMRCKLHQISSPYPVCSKTCWTSCG